MTPVINKQKEALRGSPSRDAFKHAHKVRLASSFYACDLDFIFVAKFPYRIVAFLDYKRMSDGATFSEVIAWNDLMALRPVFIIRSDNPELGPFSIYRFMGGDPAPEPPICDFQSIRQCETWEDLGEWEQELRNEL
jgi:hypothetical protein